MDLFHHCVSLLNDYYLKSRNVDLQPVIYGSIQTPYERKY